MDNCLKNFCFFIPYVIEYLPKKQGILMKNTHTSITSRDYKKELIQYRNYVASLKKKNSNYVQKGKSEQSLIASINPYDVFQSYDFIMSEENCIMREIRKLDAIQPITFAEEYYIDSEPELYEQECFLYHGLRFQQKLEKLEGIFKERKILASKYLDNFFNYGDNCNDGEYVSVTNYTDSLEFKAFVSENICLVISPLCNAHKTIYVPHNIWSYIKENNIPVKNRYSYAEHEYQVKDFVPIEMVKAIGIDYFGNCLAKGREATDKLIQDIIELLNFYDIHLPIVDIGCYNNIIYSPHKTYQKIK